MSGLASFSNCRVMNQPCFLASSMVLLIIPTARSAAGVTMTFAPRKRMSLRRSTLNGSAIVSTSGYPFAAQTIARPIPVFPLVASMTVWPGFSSPDFSAASMTPSASRSLTEPRGLKASILTKTFTPDGPRRLIRTTGVLPIVSLMLWYIRPMPLLQPCVVCEKHCALLVKIILINFVRQAEAKREPAPPEQFPRLSSEELRFSNHSFPTLYIPYGAALCLGSVRIHQSRGLLAQRAGGTEIGSCAGGGCRRVQPFNGSRRGAHACPVEDTSKDSR